MSGRVDLHTHTTVSDGVLSPEELVRRAVESGVEILAITDHDTIDGLPAARRAAPAGLAILTGAELTCSIDRREAHILAYGVDADDPAFRQALERFRLQREQRARAIVERLNALGIDLDYAEVAAISGHGTVARPHLAQALLARGVVSNLQEAFTRFLGRHAPAFVAKPALDPREAFDLVRSAGGVPSLAHPGTFQRDDLIPQLADAGLAALEVRHTEHSAAQCGHYERMATQLGLLPTGGSDFHGTPGHRSRIGSPAVPRAWAEALIAHTVGGG